MSHRLVRRISFRALSGSMPPLTSPSAACEGCLWLNQKVAEMEERVSLLCQIGEDERLIDTMLAQCSSISAAAGETTGGDLEAMVPWTKTAQSLNEDQWTRT